MISSQTRLSNTPEQCDKRARIDALRHGVNTFGVTLNKGHVAGETIETMQGRLPASKSAALSMIHQFQPEGAEPLTLEKVYIHFGEAASNRFVQDRYCFLDADTTLKNLSQDAASGVSFMGNHATGDLCSPSQYAVARTFCGRYEAGTDGKGRPFARTTFGLYMLRGIKPNGDAGPSTDDLHAMFEGGTLFDVSVGLNAGWNRCDVCQCNLDECDHIPGSTYNMSASEIKAQKKRGVPEGRCSYTIVDGHMGEVSSVYDGAVPHAGIQKTFGMRKRGHLSQEAADELLSAMNPNPRPLGRTTENKMGLFAKLFKVAQSAKTEEEFVAALEDEATEETFAPKPTVDPAVVALQEQMAQLQSQLAASQKANELAASAGVVDGLIRQFKVTPAGREQAIALRAKDPEAFDAMFAAQAPNPVFAKPGETVTGTAAAEALQNGTRKWDQLSDSDKKYARSLSIATEKEQDEFANMRFELQQAQVSGKPISGVMSVETEDKEN